MKRQRIVILHDNIPSAEAFSEEWKSIEAMVADVGATLESLGLAVASLPFTLNLSGVETRLERMKPDLVFNLVDAVDGKAYFGHLAPLLLEHMRLPFTGNSSTAIHLTTQKILSKRLMQAAGIPTAPWIEPHEILEESDAALEHRYIVKSVCEDASIGIDHNNVVSTRKEMRAIALDRRKRFGGEWFAEAFIDGRELNAGLLGSENGFAMQTVAEIEFINFPENQPRIVDYAAKWNEASAESIGTVRRLDFPAADASLLKYTKDIAAQCWQMFGLRGYARVDFRVDEKGNPFVLEVNANPCITSDAGFAIAGAHQGITYQELIKAIVVDARRSFKLPVLEWQQ